MATPNEKLAAALSHLNQKEVDGIVRSEALTRPQKERLERAGFLQGIIKGWYFTTNPLTSSGSTAWFASYWPFIRQYLQQRFGDAYCLTPESSLIVLGGSTTIPSRLGVMSPKGDNRTLNLPNGTSIFIYQDAVNFPENRVPFSGLNVMEVSEALVRVGEGFFRNRPNDAIVVLQTIGDPSHILRTLLDQGKSVVAGRLAGAFRHVGKSSFADRILSTMRGAGYEPRESNPFERPVPVIAPSRNASPYEVRLRVMWAEMRDAVIGSFPGPPARPSDSTSYLSQVEDVYAQDAYNSLSIEGYRVNMELMERVAKGVWDPDHSQTDRSSKDALAARGYFEAFQAVKQTVGEILRGAGPSIVRNAHHSWHQALFEPCVQAGILKPSDLAGYRHTPVVINGSKHVPFPESALVDAMATLFDLIESEPSAAVRAVLGHFVFVFIHPYSDGNGRLGRFLMNSMLASGGYPWTIIHLSSRSTYMSSLEKASVEGNIEPFASFVASEMALSSSRTD